MSLDKEIKAKLASKTGIGANLNNLASVTCLVLGGFASLGWQGLACLGWKGG